MEEQTGKVLDVISKGTWGYGRAYAGPVGLIAHQGLRHHGPR